MPDSNAVVWCGLAARGAAWCDVRCGAAGGGRRRACMGERAACACAIARAGASAGRACARIFIIIIIIILLSLFKIYNYVERFMRGVMDLATIPIIPF